MTSAINHHAIINLPVRSIANFVAFFKAVGLNQDENLSDSDSACFSLNDHCSVVLFTHEGYAEFCKKPIADASMTSEVVVSLNVSNPEQVDEIADAAIKAGARETLRGHRTNTMYRRVFDDLDSHSWEIFWYA
jgi:predicted lactoylglutathione lyase